VPGSGAGAVDDDLRAACLAALGCSREETRRYAERFSWRACAETFYAQLDVPPPPVRERAWRRGIQKLPSISRTMPTLTVPSFPVSGLSMPSLTFQPARDLTQRVRRMATDRPTRTRRR
jgi:hypothetical protein